MNAYEHGFDNGMITDRFIWPMSLQLFHEWIDIIAYNCTDTTPQAMAAYKKDFIAGYICATL